MSKSEQNPSIAALTAISLQDAMLVAREVIANDTTPLIRDLATQDEVEELTTGIAKTLLVIRDRAIGRSADGYEDVVVFLSRGPSSFVAEMLAHDADPEVDCQTLCRSLILRSEGRGTEEEQWESESDEGSIAFENAFDEGISRTGAFIQAAAMMLFAEAATFSGWLPQAE